MAKSPEKLSRDCCVGHQDTQPHAWPILNAQSKLISLHCGEAGLGHFPERLICRIKPYTSFVSLLALLGIPGRWVARLWMHMDAQSWCGIQVENTKS